MSQMDVIRAFLDGQRMAEPPLSTDGTQLHCGMTLIAEKRGGELSIYPRTQGAMEEDIKGLLEDFLEWRKRRERVLRAILRGREALTSAQRQAGARHPAHSQDLTRLKGAS